MKELEYGIKYFDFKLFQRKNCIRVCNVLINIFLNNCFTLNLQFVDMT